MNVYVIVTRDEDEYIEGVYTDKEKADKAVEKLRSYYDFDSQMEIVVYIYELDSDYYLSCED